MRKVLAFVALFCFSFVAASGAVAFLKDGGVWPFVAAVFAANAAFDVWESLK